MITDKVIIGCGPIGILEALYQESLGHEVIVIDKRDRLGGAWGTIDLENHPPVEFGCHIWDLDTRAMQFMRDYLDLDLAPLAPGPRFLKGNMNFPYGWKNAVFMGRKILKAPRKTTQWKNLKLSNSGYLYPKGGCTTLIEGLKRKLDSSSIKIKSGVAISKVTVQKDTVILSVDEEEIECGELVMTSLSDIQEIQVEDKIISPKSYRSEYWHAHLTVSDNVAKKFSYIRLVGDPLIHRVSNLTLQLDHLTGVNQENQLFLVGLHRVDQVKDDLKEIEKNIVSTLRWKGILSKEAKILKCNWNSYANAVIPLEVRNQLLKLSPDRVTYLHSTNLMYGISQQLDRWQGMVASTT